MTESKFTIKVNPSSELLEIAYAYSDGKSEGWKAAAEYYEKLLLKFLGTFDGITEQDIIELFDNPEEEFRLRNAALDNMGQP